MDITQPPLFVEESIGSFVVSLSLNATASEDITIQTTMNDITALGNKLITP